MSHPIDDLFKKGLDNKSYDGLEKDWQDARVLLGLDKRKRKTPIWFWWLAGMLLIGTVAGALYFQQKLSQNVQLEAINNPGNNIEKTSDLASERLIKEQTGNRSDISEHQPSESIENTATNKTGAIISKAVLTEEDFEIAEPESAIDQVRSEQEIQTENSISNVPERDIIVQKEVQEKVAKQVQEEVDVTNGSVLPDSFMSNTIEEGADQLSRNIPGSSEVRQAVYLGEIARLDMNAFPIIRKDVIESIPIPGTSHEQQVDNFRGGLFVDFDPVNKSIGGGITGNWDVNAKWSVDFGLGISRWSKSKTRNFENVLIDNRIADNTSLTSNNSYKYYSLILPVRFNYHLHRHSIFTGVRLVRPFTLDGQQEVSLSQEFLDTSSPNDPALGSSNTFDPVISMQSYNLNSAPELKKIFFHGQFGYAYHLSGNFNISVAAAYRLNRQIESSPLLDTYAQEKKNTNPWSALLRLDYLFGK